MSSKGQSLRFHVIAFSLLLTQHVGADVLWRGDFETRDLSQWNTGINPQGLSLTDECSAEGKSAGKVRITGEDSFLWNGNKSLNRSEFHHRMPAGATHEGKDTYFAFSFYLPRALSNAKHELGYWESDKTWQQMFRFNIVGTELSFQQSAANEPFWTIPGGAKPGQWQRIALNIHWSTDPDKGFVDVWVNGEAMGQHKFQTLPDKKALMFTQIGILRAQEPSVEEIFIDAAVETDNLAQLLKVTPMYTNCDKLSQVNSHHFL